MGLTLMADDRDLIIGEIRAGQRALSERLDRQDREAERREVERKQDKAEAIARAAAKDQRDEEKHAQNIIRFDRIEQKATITYGLASSLQKWREEEADPAVKWVNKHGERLIERVSKLEGEKTEEAAEERGSLKTWGLIGAIATAVGTAVGTAISYKDAIMAMLRGE